MAQFNYIINVTGDCSNVGAGVISILPTGGTAPYTVEWIDPNLGADVVEYTPSVRTGLFSNTYGLRLNDSTLPVNQEFYVNIPVSSGVCANIIGVKPTTCGQNNGSVTASTTSQYSSTNFYLYTTGDTFISSGTSNISTYVFQGLSADTYYIKVLDLGGCWGNSQSFIIDSSQIFDFGFYIVPNSSCGVFPLGKLYVTGQTGTAPYSYSWNTGAITSYITGLTAGSYSVQVTDSNGCSLTKSAVIGNVDPVGLGLFTSEPPTCLSNNGSITMILTGGTAPFYYSASTGYVEISYSRSFTLSGLSAGVYSFIVTDAGLCNVQAGTSLESPTGIQAVNVVTINSSCSSQDGAISATVIGGTAPFTYNLIGPSGNTINITTSQSVYNFTNLQSGTYTLIVQDANGCTYSTEIYLISQNKFTIVSNVTNTTCGQPNGSIYVELSSGGTAPYNYYIDNVAQVVNSNLTAFTFTNVIGGQHLVTVTDSNGCSQNNLIYVGYSEPVNFSLFSTSCGNGSDGTITAFITGGNPPFDFYWSDNVIGNPQEIKITGLTAGTYSLTVVDDNNCSLKRSVEIICNQLYSSYQIYAVGSEQFQLQVGAKCGLLQMLNQGFIDLTSGDTGCNLTSAEFIAKVSVEPLGTVYSGSFFTTTSLAIPPADNLWYSTIESLLLSIPGVTGVTVDALNNQITISSDGITLLGQEIKIELIILYDIICL